MDNLINFFRSLFLSIKNFLIMQWRGAIIGIILAWILRSTLSGVIEEISSTFWRETAKPWLFGEPIFKPFYFLLISIILLFSLLYIFIKNSVQSHVRYEGFKLSTLSSIMLNMRDNELTKYQSIMDEINKLNQAHISNPTQETLASIIEEVFQAIFRSLGLRIYTGAGIIIKDSQQEDLLTFWKVNISQPRSNKTFNIGSSPPGPTDKQRGIAGFVFIENKPDITNILDRLTGESDNPRFHQFDMVNINQPRNIAPYSSFICLPIRYNSQVIGILTIEGQKIYSFDHQSKQLLQPIADQIGTLLKIYGVVP